MINSDVTKHSIREKIWSYLEENDIAQFPEPVYNQIPNFQGAEATFLKMKNLKEYQTAGIVKVYPDALQKHLTLSDERKFSTKLGLDSKVDVVILGSVAVSPSGRRIGKGEGFADLEFAMMSMMGAVNSETPVITVVHDCQVIDMADHLFGPHDVPADIIVTPTRVIYCEPKLPKPSQIIWDLITEEKLREMPALRALKEIEEKNKN